MNGARESFAFAAWERQTQRRSANRDDRFVLRLLKLLGVAALKNLVDRMLPLSSMAMAQVNGRYVHVGQRDFSHLRYVMICGCGFPNSRRNFEPAVRQFELLFPRQHTILTVPESPMFNAPEAAVVTVPRLALVKRAGRQYGESGTIDEALLAEIGSPMIPEETYAKIVNGTV